MSARPTQMWRQEVIHSTTFSLYSRRFGWSIVKGKNFISRSLSRILVDKALLFHQRECSPQASIFPARNYPSDMFPLRSEAFSVRSETTRARRFSRIIETDIHARWKIRVIIRNKDQWIVRRLPKNRRWIARRVIDRKSRQLYSRNNTREEFIRNVSFLWFR